MPFLIQSNVCTNAFLFPPLCSENKRWQHGAGANRKRERGQSYKNLFPVRTVTERHYSEVEFKLFSSDRPVK